MALPHEPMTAGNQRRSRPTRKEGAFRTHLAVYLCVGLFLLTLNILTSPFDLWFYWPLFFWGWGLVFHALATYGADAPSRVPQVFRSLLPWLAGAAPVQKPAAGPASVPAPFAAQAFAEVHERIERLEELALSTDDVDIRAKLLSFTAAAESAVAGMARDRADAATVRRFDADVLGPVASVAARSVILERRDDPASKEALRKLTDDDLVPLLRRLNPGDGAPVPSPWGATPQPTRH